MVFWFNFKKEKESINPYISICDHDDSFKIIKQLLGWAGKGGID